jgi:hypothetical protein
LLHLREPFGDLVPEPTAGPPQGHAVVSAGHARLSFLFGFPSLGRQSTGPLLLALFSPRVFFAELREALQARILA